jgi:hypothetical protein
MLNLLPMLSLLLLAILVALLSRSARADEVPRFATPDPGFFTIQPDHALAVDLLAFSQWDNGGDPLVDEGFRYEALSVDLRLKQSDQVATRGTAVLAYLQNNPLMILPKSITNAHVTSASVDFVTLDASLATELASADQNWRFSPGLFYHHQWAYLAGGVDLDLRRVLAGGDATLRAAYSARFAHLEQVHWDGSAVNGDSRLTHNLILGWTQVLSPSLVTHLGFQYTRQNGLLDSTLQFVGLYNSSGEPVQLVNEVLPRVRNRGQVNLRGRYTPSVGTSIGLDMSGYYDDWALLNLALEPSLELPIFGGSRLRVWYRVSDQKGTKYFSAMPMTAAGYLTQNSNLGSFVMQSPGLLVLVPIDRGPGPRWMIRGSALGFYRSDRIFGVGGTLGCSVEW